MYDYQITTSEGSVVNLDADWFDYTSQQQALFYHDKDLPVLVAAFNNPVSVINLHSFADKEAE
jgi:hypothetical protein